MARKIYNHIDLYFDVEDPDACLCYFFLKKLGRKRSLFISCLLRMFFSDHANLDIENLTDEQVKALAELYVYNNSSAYPAKKSSAQLEVTHRKHSSSDEEKKGASAPDFNMIDSMADNAPATEDAANESTVPVAEPDDITEQKGPSDVPDDVAVDFDLLNGLALFG